MSDLEIAANDRTESPAWPSVQLESKPEPGKLPATEKSSLPVQKNGIFEVKSLLAISVVVLFAVTFVVQAFRVPSESMEKTLLAGDFLLADKVHFAQGGS